MIRTEFIIFDSKAQTYSDVFFAPNTAVGLRLFHGLCNDPATQMYRYPEDFTLFERGKYDPSSGKSVTGMASHKSHGLAVQFKETAPPELSLNEMQATQGIIADAEAKPNGSEPSPAFKAFMKHTEDINPK